VAIVKRYMQRGMTFEALRPDFDNCGGPGRVREIPAGVKTGRPRTVSKGKGISTSKLSVANFSGRRLLLKSEAAYISQACDYLIGKFYSKTIGEGNHLRTLWSRTGPRRGNCNTS